jgi:microcystin-dependent protein
MAEPFLAEIRIVPLNFAPQGWALCDGPLLPIAQNTALFSLVGTFYGGNGTTTFALPDLRGQAPMHPGSAPGLTPRIVGEQGGSETVQLTLGQMPAHSHLASATDTAAASTDPTGLLPAVAPDDTYQNLGRKALASMHPQAIGITGGSQAHNNMQPYLVLNFIIALTGIFPSRG